MTVSSAVAKTKQADPVIKLCFVGNSYTWREDVPGKFESICYQHGINVKVSMFAFDDAYLWDHASDEKLISKLEKGSYDIVVLQEESHLVWQEPETSAKYARILSDAAKQGGARVLLYQTMSYRDGGAAEQARYIKAYDDLAGNIGAEVARCGEAFWDYMERYNVPLEIMFDDWQHPSETGCWVVAKCMYETMKTTMNEMLPAGNITVRYGHNEAISGNPDMTGTVIEFFTSRDGKDSYAGCMITDANGIGYEAVRSKTGNILPSEAAGHRYSRIVGEYIYYTDFICSAPEYCRGEYSAVVTGATDLSALIKRPGYTDMKQTDAAMKTKDPETVKVFVKSGEITVVNID